MLTDFQNSFTGTLNGKFATHPCLNITPHLNYAATLPCEMSVYKNDRAPEEIEEIEIPNCHARLGHSKIFCKIFVW